MSARLIEPAHHRQHPLDLDARRGLPGGHARNEDQIPYLDRTSTATAVHEIHIADATDAQSSDSCGNSRINLPLHRQSLSTGRCGLVTPRIVDACA